MDVYINKIVKYNKMAIFLNFNIYEPFGFGRFATFVHSC